MILIPYHIIIGVIESWVHRDHPDGVIAESDAYDADCTRRPERWQPAVH